MLRTIINYNMVKLLKQKGKVQMAMHIDWNTLSKQWSDNHFQIGPVVKFVRDPGGLYTSYQTFKPSFTIIKRGQGMLILDKVQYKLETGSVVHTCPDMWLKAWDSGDGIIEFYRILYDVEETEHSCHSEEYQHYKLMIGENPHMYAILDQMCDVSCKGDIQSGFQMKTLFYQFLNELRLSANKFLVNEHRTIIEESISYIHLHIQESHSLFSLASRYGLSPKYFSELFFKVTGVSPINYIVRYRMNIAETMLLTTNASIREIAACVGYSDPYQFSKIFKKYKGAAPSALKTESHRRKPRGG